MKNEKILIGAHMSIAKGFCKAVERAHEIGCTTMQIFTKNNKSWFGRKITDKETELFKQAVKKYKIDALSALGYPVETSVSEEMKDSIKYWKDEKGVLHVPKRKLEDIVWRNLEGR